MRAAGLFIAVLLAAMWFGARVLAHAPDLTREPPPLSEYFSIGVEHILEGIDHLAFLLGVVLIASRTREVLLAVTAFTLAHSVTLALSVLGLVSISPRLVEPLIALSVAYVGLENCFIRDARGRFRLTFLFGLIHGLGFAGALREVGLPEAGLAAALALFNLGVEAGQLLVLAVVLPVLVWLRRRERAALFTTRAVNLVLVGLGVLWALERTLDAGPASAVNVAEPALQGMQLTAAQQAEPLRTARADSAARAVPPTPGRHADVDVDRRSVYRSTPEPSPLAQRLCEVAQRLPRVRRAECEGGTPGVTLERECSRVLGAALESSALSVNAAAAEACIAAQEARYASCEFSRAVSLTPLDACTGLWQGSLAAGATCRSALECQPGLHCDGSSPLDVGRCRAPKPAGATCGLATDALAAYLPVREMDHPECSGSCQHGRCAVRSE